MFPSEPQQVMEGPKFYVCSCQAIESFKLIERQNIKN